jgi:serine/threonine-protein kinase
VGHGDQAGIEEAVGRELSRMGIQGTLVLAGRSMELRSAGAPVSIEIDQILQQWPLLPEEMRARKADEIARRLASAERATRMLEGPPEPRLDPGARRKVVRGVLGFFGLLLVVGLARVIIPRLALEKADAGVPTENDTARTDRLARACDAVRENVYRGAAFGPMSLEGFAVELWLGKRGEDPIRRHEGLTGLLAGSKLGAGADAKLAEIVDGTAEIVDGLDGDAARRSPGWSAAAVVFRGGYARAFFDDDGRARFLALADRAATATGADLGALYARCAHRPTHDIGAWFRGPDLPGATAAMVYAMGLFAETKMVDRGALGAIKAPVHDGGSAGGELDALRKAAADVSDAIPRFVGTAGGAITGGRPTTLTFPLAGPVRAVGATRDMAKKMGIAPVTGD